jgi:hypothetical protein
MSTLAILSLSSAIKVVKATFKVDNENDLDIEKTFNDIENPSTTLLSNQKAQIANVKLL